ENLKLPSEDQVILEDPTSSTRTLSSLQNLDRELSFTNQFFVEKPQEEEPKKTNTKSEALIPTSTATTSAVTTIITHPPPPPPQSQQSITNQTLLKCIAYEVAKAFYPDVVHLQFQMEECHKLFTNQIDWVNPRGDQVKINKFYIDRHDSTLSQKEVRTYMWILSVVSIKIYSRYGYDYLSEIVLRRDDFQEYTIAEKDFKNLHLNDFKDLNMLLLQGHLDHLPGSDKHMLSTTVKLWTQNLVIRQWVEDFQLGIESYQTQLNLTKPRWDAKDYKFKPDYTIIESPRAVVFPVNNNA
nr:hypothetical protein [Tanacetum cinerariifolium]